MRIFYLPYYGAEKRMGKGAFYLNLHIQKGDVGKSGKPGVAIHG
ncbi:hypothetical protein [Pseudomonas putida]